MDYSDKNGIVGTYRGIDVYRIPYEALTKDSEGEDIIFAVSYTDIEVMELVLHGVVIGTMTATGKVKMGQSYAFKYYQVEVPKTEMKLKVEEKPIKTESVEVNPTVLGLDVSAGYGLYTRTVDDFFKGLDKLWQEIDSAINVS